MALADVLDPNTTLVAGSVQVSQGTFTTANGDVQAALGTLPGGNAQATITFRVTVNNPLPAGVSRVANQASVSATNAASTLSDDPDTLETDDTTITPVVAQPVLDATKTSPRWWWTPTTTAFRRQEIRCNTRWRSEQRELAATGQSPIP